VVGLAATFGSGAMTNSINEFDDADLFFVTGSNTTEQHPLIGSRIINAKERGAKIILMDPREIPLARFADLYMRQHIGSDVAVLNGMMNIIIEEDLYDNLSRTEPKDSISSKPLSAAIPRG
jgi:anaerobic selenocysteine-containing dehydrogenase